MKKELIWYKYIIKEVAMHLYGWNKNLIANYDEFTLEKLRHIKYQNIPLSVLLSYHELCQGNCEVFSMLLSKAFKNTKFEVVYAYINDLELNPKYNVDNKYHCFLECVDMDNNKWVYDTSVGLRYQASLFYKIQNPRIIKRLTEKDLKQNELYQMLEKEQIDLGVSLNDIASSPSATHHSQLQRELNLENKKKL